MSQEVQPGGAAREQSDRIRLAGEGRHGQTNPTRKQNGRSEHV